MSDSAFLNVGASKRAYMYLGLKEVGGLSSACTTDRMGALLSNPKRVKLEEGYYQFIYGVLNPIRHTAFVSVVNSSVAGCQVLGSQTIFPGGVEAELSIFLRVPKEIKISELNPQLIVYLAK